MAEAFAVIFGAYAGFRVGQELSSFISLMWHTRKTLIPRYFQVIYDLMDSHETYDLVGSFEAKKKPVLPYHHHIEAMRRYADDAYRAHLANRKLLLRLFAGFYSWRFLLVVMIMALLNVALLFMSVFFLLFFGMIIKELIREGESDFAWLAFTQQVVRRAYYAYSRDDTIDLNANIPAEWQHT